MEMELGKFCVCVCVFYGNVLVKYSLRKFPVHQSEVSFKFRVEVSMNEWTAQMAVIAQFQRAWLKSRIPTKEFGLWDLPNFSTVLRPSCSAALTHSVHKACLK